MKLNVLIRTNSTNQEVFVLFKKLIIEGYHDHDYNVDLLMLYARFLGRTCYGRTQNKIYLLKSKKILYKVLKLHYENKINDKGLKFSLFQTYSWLGIITFYLGKKSQCDAFFAKALDHTYNRDDQLKVYEWKTGVFIKSKRYESIIDGLAEFHDLEFSNRLIGYILILYYELGYQQEFEIYCSNYLQSKLKSYSDGSGYFFIELGSEVLVLSINSLTDSQKNEVRLRGRNLNKQLKVIIKDSMTYSLLLKTTLIALNKGGKIYDFEGVERFILIYLKMKYEL